MKTTNTPDNVTLAYELTGQGPILITIAGALSDRHSATDLAQELSDTFQVLSYDRRGRGESSDSPEAAIELEIADIFTLAEKEGNGDSVVLYGHSSGASLALAAAAAHPEKVSALILYEPPFNNDPQAQERAIAFRKELEPLIQQKKSAEAAELFMQFVGIPVEVVAATKAGPMWQHIASLGLSLRHDFAVFNEEMSIPEDQARMVRAPTLIMAGDESYPFMTRTAAYLANLIKGSTLLILPGQSHNPEAGILATHIKEFFKP